VHGGNYVAKFGTKTGGFIVMRNRLKRWWNVAPLWPICLSVLFGKDVAKIDVSRPLDLFGLAEMFSDAGNGKVIYPEMLPVIAGMLKAGIGAIVVDQGNDGVKEPSDNNKAESSKMQTLRTGRVRSLSLSSQPGKCKIPIDRSSKLILLMYH
jgi:beige protein homolog 1